MERQVPAKTDQMSRLKRDMLRRLSTLGGHAWESPRMNNGAPIINFVWNGQYFGFYPSLEGRGTKPRQAETFMRKRLNECDAVCAVVHSVEEMESVMNLNISIQERHKAFPRKKVVALLRRWGEGKPDSPEIERAVLSLSGIRRETIYSVFLERRRLNHIAKDEGISYKSAHKRYVTAVDAVMEYLLKRGIGEI
jgi:hypothetical protein